MAEALECPLPQVAQALQPFIKTRQEALRIRRILSLYLASTIEGLTDGDIPFCLPVSVSNEMRVNNIPSRITGLRRDYLLALQANIRARNEYDSISERISESFNAVSVGESRQIDNEASAATSSYLELWEAQRKHEKLNIVNDYIDELARKEPANPEYLTLLSIKKAVDPAPDLTFTAGDDMFTASTENSDIDALTTRLEKTLLRVNSTLESERRLLAETKSKHLAAVASGASHEPNSSAKVHALTRTRDELISWIEDRLSKMNEQEDEVDDFDPTDNHVSIEQQKANIQKLYNNYLDVRRNLIKLTKQKRSINTTWEPIAQRPNPSIPTDETPQHPKQQASKILPYVTEHLIPAADAQKAVHQQKTHILKSLTAQNEITAAMLDKLADESHLLANYPIQTDQQHLQNTITALGGPKPSPSRLGGIVSYDGESNMVAKGQMWASAADSAQKANNATLREHLGNGEKHVHAAEISLSELRRLLNGGVENKASDEGDIWVTESRVKADPEGPWSGVNGRIGIERKK